MKALGNWSISFILKKIITVLFYLEFLLILTLPLVFLDDDGIRYSWPITSISPISDPVATTTNSKISDFVIDERYEGTTNISKKLLSFEDSSFGRRLLQTLHNVVTISVILMITYWLKKIFDSLADNNPFVSKNASRVRWIAWTVLGLVIFDVVKAFLYRMYTLSTISLSGATFDIYNFSFDLRAFLIGILLLIIAELFKRGHDYQTDSESIV
jgi:hypothetical protein